LNEEREERILREENLAGIASMESPHVGSRRMRFSA
jgi:hypothetical protein